MYKEKYERTELEIIKFLTEDVIMTSGGFPEEEDDELPIRGNRWQPLAKRLKLNKIQKAVLFSGQLFVELPETEWSSVKETRPEPTWFLRGQRNTSYAAEESANAVVIQAANDYRKAMKELWLCPRNAIAGYKRYHKQKTMIMMRVSGSLKNLSNNYLVEHSDVR